MSIADIRKDYKKAFLSEKDVHSSPIAQFDQWWNEAVNAEIEEVNAMTLATVAADGRPSARIVLLKGFDQSGFVFFTNYLSRKGNELNEHPEVSLLFFWKELERQVRIEGKAVKVPPAESDEYFLSRPLESQIGAWASPQSQTITSREVLEENMQKMRDHFEQLPMKRPPHWGGYCVVPDGIEFWQGRPGRLHDRILYSLDATGNWKLERLAP
jgi:pyridoxamine 5'-phosphate oxidase